ncbi:MAG: hypothetical protein GXO43_07130 [Crenarchaeota archaeon]|nr:hypothetical protein [Thermoproteota archaeon]
MKNLRVLEENNAYVVLGFNGKGSEVALTAYNEMSRLSAETGCRRFTLLIATNKPSPYYIEDLRYVLQNNIAYTIVLRYVGLNMERLSRLIEEIKSTGRPLIGVVESDMEEISRLLEEKQVKVERV